MLTLALFLSNQQQMLEDIRSGTELFERSEFSVSCEYQKHECADLKNYVSYIKGSFLFFKP